MSLEEHCREKRAEPQRKAVLPRLLFVDDDANVLEAARVYHGRNYAVDTCTSAFNALELLSSAEADDETPGCYSVVISDMRMPGMDGIAFLAQAFRRAPNTVRIVLTGHADLASAREAINQGFVYRFLAKPCPAAVMRGHLEDAIRYHRETLMTHSQLEEQLGEATARLRRSEQMATRASLAAAIAERVRGSSEVINAVLDSLKDRSAEAGLAASKELEELRQVSLRLRDDASQLLNVSGSPVSQRCSDLCEAVVETVSALRGAGVLRRLPVELRLPAERAQVALGRTLLDQLIATLLRDLVERATDLELSVERTNGMIVLVVHCRAADKAALNEQSIDLRVIAELAKAEGGSLECPSSRSGQRCIRLSLPEMPISQPQEGCAELEVADTNPAPEAKEP